MMHVAAATRIRNPALLSLCCRLNARQGGQDNYYDRVNVCADQPHDPAAD